MNLNNRNLPARAISALPAPIRQAGAGQAVPPTSLGSSSAVRVPHSAPPSPTRPNSLPALRRSPSVIGHYRRNSLPSHGLQLSTSPASNDDAFSEDSDEEGDSPRSRKALPSPSHPIVQMSSLDGAPMPSVDDLQRLIRTHKSTSSLGDAKWVQNPASFRDRGPAFSRYGPLPPLPTVEKASIPGPTHWPQPGMRTSTALSPPSVYKALPSFRQERRLSPLARPNSPMPPLNITRTFPPPPPPSSPVLGRDEPPSTSNAGRIRTRSMQSDNSEGDTPIAG